MPHDRRSPLRLAWRRLIGRDLLYRPEIEVPCDVLGTEYGAHGVSSLGLGPDSVIYSFGVGQDASFDLALIERFRATVHAFDPTPRSIAWCEAQDFPPEFQLHPWGLAARDGLARFSPPANPAHISHRMDASGSGREGEAVELPVRTLTTVMAELGHTRIDVLKMDVEGAEYEVIEGLCENPVEIDQILIEFHHQFRTVPLARTKSAIETLRGLGYRIFRVADNGREYSFIHQRVPAASPA